MVPVFVGAEDMGNFDSFLLVKETLNWGEFRRIHNHAVIGVTSLDEVRIIINVTFNVIDLDPFNRLLHHFIYFYSFHMFF